MNENKKFWDTKSNALKMKFLKNNPFLCEFIFVSTAFAF